ncbi:site-specific integrase [Rhizobium leguminosarum]|uniref:tyrosine-type recombinase/integrase n=1 Tax=Rhizobium leguminosarum TaxID=384 RepID=UPI00103075A1|nr:site-specific integrase [Rhizobium leguminosarum]TBE93139.1 site-specific integrase [Rhizobium leguminosarum]
MRAFSNLQKSRELHGRLSDLLQGCDIAAVPFFRKRVFRPWVADKIGCEPGTLTTNARLRKTLCLWEQENAPTSSPDTIAIEHWDEDDDEDDSNVVPLFTRLNKGLIRSVDVVVRGKAYDIPMLYWTGGLDEVVCDYLRYLRVKKKHAFSSVGETAKKLRLFRRFQRAYRLKDTDVTDDFLISWQHSMERNGIGLNRRNDCITSVHSFFEWAELTGLLKNHVQIAAKSAYSDELGADYVFPIASKQITVRKKGQTYYTWVSTLIEPGGESSFGKRATPTSKQIERLMLAVSDHSRNSLRNSLLLSWALQTGARVSEILQVRLDDLPSMDEIGEFLDRNPEYLWVVVKRKNCGESKLRVPIDLVLSTLDYLWNDNDRAKIVEQHGECGFVFLSEEGSVLTADSVTRICGRFFEIAEISNANIHRLRARYITEIIEGVLDDLEAKGQSVDLTSDWGETVLTMAKNLMGHSHIMSLRPYLTEIQVRRIREDGTIVPREELERRRLRKELDKALVTRVKHNGQLAEADRLMGAGKMSQAAQMLRVMADDLEASERAATAA